MNPFLKARRALPSLPVGRRILFSALAPLAAAGLFGIQAPATAAVLVNPDGSVEFTFDTVYGGASPTTGTGGTNPPPWLTALIKNATGAGNVQGVQIDIKSNLVNASEYFDSVAFNIINILDANSITTDCSPLLPTCSSTTSNYSSNGTNISNAVKGLDFEIDLPTANQPPSSPRFNGQEELFFSIFVAGSTLVPSDFNTPNSPGQGEGLISNVCAAAKVNGLSGNPDSTTIGTNCNGNGNGEKVPGPLPILGAAAAFGYSRKIRARIRVLA